MVNVTLILPLEATTVSDSRSDSSSDTAGTAGATAAEQQWSDTSVIAVQLRSDSRSDSSGVTVEKYWYNSGATT